MTSITISDILTIVFVLVDDWYQVEAVSYSEASLAKNLNLRIAK